MMNDSILREYGSQILSQYKLRIISIQKGPDTLERKPETLRATSNICSITLRIKCAYKSQVYFTQYYSILNQHKLDSNMVNSK